MDEHYHDFVRNEIKEGLFWLSLHNTAYLNRFRAIYSIRYPEESMDYIVNTMKPDDLEWALCQIRNTIDKVSGKMGLWSLDEIK